MWLSCDSHGLTSTTHSAMCAAARGVVGLRPCSVSDWLVDIALAFLFVDDRCCGTIIMRAAHVRIM